MITSCTAINNSCAIIHVFDAIKSGRAKKIEKVFLEGDVVEILEALE